MHQPDDGAMRHGNAFGSIGGARRIHHAGQICRPVAIGQVLPWLVREGPCLGIKGHQRSRAEARIGGESPSGQDHLDRRVVEQELNASNRIGSIQRDVSSAGLEDGQQPDQQFRRAFQTDAHSALRSHPQLPQMMRQLVRTDIQLLVAQFSLFARHRHRIRRPLHLRLEQFVDAAFGRIVRAGVVPLDQHLLSLCLAQQRQCRDPPIRMGRDPFQQGPQVSQHPANGVILEAAAVPGQVQQQAGPGVPGEDERIVGCAPEPEGAVVPLLPLFAQQLVQPVVLEHHEALEQRPARGHLAPLLDLRQRSEFVFPQFQPLPAKLLQPVPQQCRAGDANPQRQGVDQQAHQRLRTWARPATDARRPKDHVLRAGIPAEQQGPHSLQQRVGGHAPVPGQGQQGRRLVLRKPKLLAGVGLLVLGQRAGRTIHPQRRGRRETAQRSPPVSGGFADILTPKPAHVVPERPGRFQSRLCAPPNRLVQGEHLLQEDQPGATVQQRVVRRPDQPVIRVRQPEQVQTQQRRPIQREPLPPVVSHKRASAAAHAAGRPFPASPAVPGERGRPGRFPAGNHQGGPGKNGCAGPDAGPGGLARQRSGRERPGLPPGCRAAAGRKPHLAGRAGCETACPAAWGSADKRLPW